MTALQHARAYGVAVLFADLGEWGTHALNSEYDPHVPAIRINVRVAERMRPAELGEFLARAVGHELYHHREALGEVASLPTLAERERAADDFARALLDE